MKARKGFTLVEILIVVVILGILAAIVIPQFSDASTQSKLSSCRTTLQSLRSQVELYKIQHNDNPPASPEATEVWPVMTGYTDVDGNTNAAKTAVFCYGPYIQQIPTNPWNDSKIFDAADGAGVGYVYDDTTGDLWIAVADLLAGSASEIETAGKLQETGDAL